MIYHLDYETTSKCDIKLGAYRYACDPSTRILLAAVSKGDAEPAVWRFDEADSVESRQAETWLAEAIESGSLIYAHNSQFELAVSQTRLLPDMGLDAQPDINTWRCTQAMCRRAAIPESLGKAAAFLKLPDQKEAVGKSLIKIFSNLEELVTLEPPVGMIDPESQKVMKNGNLTKGKKPKNRKSNSPILDATVLWDWQVKVKGEKMSVRAAWDLFIHYCRQDVKVEQQIHQKLAKFEFKTGILDSFLWDMRMNARGVPVNLAALHNAQRVISEYQVKLEARMHRMCGCTSSQGKVLLKWLRERGYAPDNLQADTVESALTNPGELTPLAMEVLRHRALLSFSAIKKIPTMIAAACPDGRVRGTTLWHGARTGRATGRIIQPQNMKKATIGDSALAYSMICDGCELDEFEALWDSPLEVMSSCARHFMQLPSGRMLDGDYTGVESRISAWLSGEEEKLQSILDGKCQYKLMASEIVYHIPYDEVTKEQRTVGKPIELSCIAEGQLVLTDRGLIPIEQVRRCHRVWDGAEWVHHEGVIYQGQREVIDYEGLKATADHNVFCRDSEGRLRKIPFGAAKSLQNSVVTAGRGRKEVWVPDHPNRRDFQEREKRRSLRKDALRLWEGAARVLHEPHHGEKQSVQIMQRSQPLPPVVKPKSDGTEAALHKSERPTVEALWGEGYPVQLPIGVGCLYVDHGEPRTGERPQPRSDRQRRELRSGQHSVGYPFGAEPQYPSNHLSERRKFQPGSLALRDRSGAAETEIGDDSRANLRGRTGSGENETKKVEGHPATVRVFDILNAGPRRRFTVSGKLVSNCVYGTGGKGLQTALRDTHSVHKTLKECDDIVKAYRTRFAKLVETWGDMENAAKAAILEGATTKVAEGKLTFARFVTAGTTFLAMRLPSSRWMFYPSPEVKRVFKKYSKEEMSEPAWKAERKGYWRDEISFYGKVEGKWCRIHTWGSRLFENACQAIGADLLNYGVMEAEREGFDVFMIVHDQALAEEDGRPIDKYLEALCRKQAWAETFPLDATGDVVPFYLKD